MVGPQPPYSFRKVSVDALRELLERLMRAAGCAPEPAATIADVFLEADLRGHSIQGLDHVWTTLAGLRSGRLNPDPRPQIIRERAGAVLVDGDSGPGQVAAVFAADVALRKARHAGCCVAGILDADDIFMLGYYAERIARAGLVGLVFTNTYPPRVHPAGGTAPILGTNPLAIAVPTAGDDPVILDCATSSLAIGHVRIASYHGEEIPEGVALGPDGSPTRDAAAAMQGAVAPLAGHKGYGLGLCIGLISGPLVGALVGSALKDLYDGGAGAGGGRGHLIIAIDPAAFGDPQIFQTAVSAYVEEIKSSRKASGVTEILVPGEGAFARRARSLREGVEIYEAVWQRTAALAEELGVQMPV